MAKEKNGNRIIILVVMLILAVLGIVGGAIWSVGSVKSDTEKNFLINTKQDKTLERHEVKIEKNQETDVKIFSALGKIDKNVGIIMSEQKTIKEDVKELRKKTP